MEEYQQKAFDFASDYTKQLITLSTAVIAFMITFLNDVIKDNNTSAQFFLFGSWIFFILSIGFGIIRLMALTGNLDPIQGKKDISKPLPNLTITSFNVRFPGIVQVCFFLLAIVFAGIFGCNRLKSPKASEQKTSTIIISKETLIKNDTIIKTDTCFLK